MCELNFKNAEESNFMFYSDKLKETLELHNINGIVFDHILSRFFMQSSNTEENETAIQHIDYGQVNLRAGQIYGLKIKNTNILISEIMNNTEIIVGSHALSNSPLKELSVLI